jgi:hypothetical protein
MSIGSISDALSQISTIEGQIQQLQSGALLDSVLGVTSGSSSSTDTTSGSSGTSSTDFSGALAQAQGTAATADATADTDATDDDTASSTGGTYGSLADSELGTVGSSGSATSSSDAATTLASLTGSAGLAATSGVAATTGLPTTSGVSTSGVTLPASASSLLTSGQQQFASSLSADTGLNPGVVTAWLLSEESGGAAQSRQAAGNNDWLNIGYTGSGTYGTTDSVWSDPTTAASATAQWLQGQDSISGYGTASSGIQSILSSVGQTPQAQITALQSSGWSSSGYPDLSGVYAQVTQA